MHQAPPLRPLHGKRAADDLVAEGDDRADRQLPGLQAVFCDVDREADEVLRCLLMLLPLATWAGT